MIIIKFPYKFLCDIILILFISSTYASTDTLRLVHMVYRHGDRSPTRTFPSDPIQEGNWTQGFGQLSVLGMQQHHGLGQMFRKRYGDNFLSEKYSRYEIRVRSTDMDRTLMSAESDLSGLYPPVPDQQFDKDIKWQPIPVHTVELTTDSLLDPDTKCPKYDQLFDEVFKTDEAKQISKEHQNTLDIAGNNSGLNTSDFRTVSSWVPDALFCEHTHNFSLPSWAVPIYDDLQYLAAIEFYFKFKTPEMRHLTAGVFLNELLTQSQSKVNGDMDERRKIFMYSAHDTTIGSIMTALGLYHQGDYPPSYASTLIFELHEPTKGKFEMQIYWKNDTDIDTQSQPVIKKLDGCTESCPFDNFVKLVKPMSLTVEERDEACTIKKSDNVSALALSLLIIMMLIIVGLMILTAFYIYKRTCHNQGYRAANFGSAPYN